MANPQFSLFSPTFDQWKARILAFTAYLVNTQEQMQAVLEETREDVDAQFDENQKKWKSLKKYTKRKKERNQKDPRILHETNEGEGLRLRDAYKQTGKVNEIGELTYFYPPQKLYAKDHQEPPKNVKRDDGKSAANARHLQAEEDRLDREFAQTFGFDDDDIFTNKRVQHPKPTNKQKKQTKPKKPKKTAQALRKRVSGQSVV